MAMNRSQFRRQLQLGLNTVFGIEYKRYPEEWRDAFSIETSVKAYEEDVISSGFGAAPVKPEGRGVSYDEGREGWTARYNHETIALAFALTEEAEEDGLYGSLGARYSKALARSLQHTKEIKGANIFNNGFDTSYRGGDGKPLYATDHPLLGGGTFANKLTTAADLSETAMEDILNLIGGFVDERGIPVMTTAQRLLVPIQQQFSAHRIMYSKLRVGTSDNDANAIKDMGMLPGGFSVNHRFTDPDAWFIITDAPDGLKHFVRKRVSRGMEGDFDTGDARYKARERYSFGWSDPRGSAASEGA